MGNFKNKVARFMYGRYGVDKLYIACMVFFIILSLCRLFILNTVVNMILSTLMLFIFIWMFFRVFSKKIYKRRREEAVYLSIMSKVTGPFKLAKRKFKERKTHKYIKCKQCRAKLRLPRRKGTLSVICPKCKHEFKYKMK